LDRLGRAGVDRLVEAPLEVGELARGGVDVDVGRDVGPCTGLRRRGGLRAHVWPPRVCHANLVPWTPPPSLGRRSTRSPSRRWPARSGRCACTPRPARPTHWL